MEVALNLKDRGLDIQSFAPLVRLRHVLEEEVGWISSAVRLGQGEKKEENEDIVSIILDPMVMIMMTILTNL